MLLQRGDQVSGSRLGENHTREATRKLILNPKTASYETLDGPSRELVQKTIGFFEQKGKERLLDDEKARVAGMGDIKRA